jgi:hypothetical protein
MLTFYNSHNRDFEVQVVVATEANVEVVVNQVVVTLVVAIEMIDVLIEITMTVMTIEDEMTKTNITNEHGTIEMIVMMTEEEMIHIGHQDEIDINVFFYQLLFQLVLPISFQKHLF